VLSSSEALFFFHFEDEIQEKSYKENLGLALAVICLATTPGLLPPDCYPILFKIKPML